MVPAAEPSPWRRGSARLLLVGAGYVFALLAGRPEDRTGPLLMAIVTTFVGYGLYECLTIGLSGRTIGKRLCGLRAVALDGDRARRAPGPAALPPGRGNGQAGSGRRS
jgi:uncharacterized RDD family membrane protein YckC